MTDSRWVENAFHTVAAPASVDGGFTSSGVLWHQVGSRWGHSMHPMCSYHGMFPAKLVHYFLQRFTDPGDTVLDPFSGRGTTVLQARAEGRRAVGSDLNPLAYVLTQAKANPPEWQEVNDYVDRLESDFASSGRGTGASTQVSADVEMLFHPRTLTQLCFIRDRLLSREIVDWTPSEYMVAGAIAGILHGGHRSDGTSAYLSISMPNTFSMAPSYVRRYIDDKGLVAPSQNVFERLRDKIARLYLDSVCGLPGRVMMEDASQMDYGGSVADESVDLIVTSPPYLRVVNYGTSNWIRLWWLGLEDVGRNSGSGRRVLDADLDHRHGYESYCSFMLSVMRGTARVLKPDGVAVFVIGDVARPGGSSLALAEDVWRDVGEESKLNLVEVIEDSLQPHNKVSRIWGETKGRATDCDRLLVLGRSDGSARKPRDVFDWAEPYKDAGPDSAHARIRARG